MVDFIADFVADIIELVISLLGDRIKNKWKKHKREKSGFRTDRLR